MCNLLFTTFLLFIVLVLSDEQFLTKDEVGYPGQCDPPFRPTSGGFCYFLSHGVMNQTWKYAQEICSWLHPQGALAEFHTLEELLDATFLLFQDDSSCTRWNNVGPWIGGRELGETNVFVWDSTNTPIEHTNWAESEPDSGTCEDGIVMSCYASYEWLDMEATSVLPFLCEAPANPPPVTLECPSSFLLLGERCYWIEEELTLDWDDSQVFCSSLAAGGKLVEFETWEEYDTLVQYLTTVEEPCVNHPHWIGAESSNISGRPGLYKWTSTQKPLTFYNWIPSQPDNFDEPTSIDINCINLFHMGDLPKTTRINPLCEVAPIETAQG